MQQTRRPMPFVSLNIAMTADGKIATESRDLASFSSPRDREQLLKLRAQADAVMAGARTLDEERVNLGPGPVKYRRLRIRRKLLEYNLRVVVSGSGTIDPEAEIFRHRFSPIIVLTTKRVSPRALRRLQQLADEVKICGSEQINFAAALRWLRAKWGVRRLVCEGGGELNSALLKAGLVDEINLTICPQIFGGRRAPTIADGEGFKRLAQALPLALKSARKAGDEIFLVYRVKKGLARPVA